MSTKATEEASVPIVTNVDEVLKIIDENKSFHNMVEKFTDVKLKKDDHQWGNNYDQIQDEFDFLMYLYNNVPECKDDPLKYVNKLFDFEIKIGKPIKNPIYKVRKVITRDYNTIDCKTDKQLIKFLRAVARAKTIDDFLSIQRKQHDLLTLAVYSIFETIYPENNIAARELFSIMCWWLVIKGHVKNEESFSGFLA